MSDAPTITALQIGDPPQRWAQLGFAVDGAGRCPIGAVLVALGAAGEGIVQWSLSGGGAAHARDDIDGIATRFEDPPAVAECVHPNTAISIDHVVLATPDIDRTVGALTAVGMRLRRERRVATGRQAFFRHGEAVLEVVGPPSPQGSAPARLWGLTITVADLSACARLLGDRLGRAHAAVQPGRQIASVRPAAGLGTQLALMSPAAPQGARGRTGRS